MESLGWRVPQVMQQQVLTSSYPGRAQSCPFINVWSVLIARTHVHVHAVCVLFAHLCLRTAILTGAGLGYTIVMDSMFTWLHCLLVGGIDYRKAWNRQWCTVTEAQNHYKGRGGNRSSQEWKGDTEQTCNWERGKKIGNRSIPGARLYTSLECMVCT